MLLNARYEAYVTSTGTNNPSCNQSAPCGVFQTVIQNIESSNIPNDDLYIHINGSNPSFVATSCEVTLTGNITFILDSSTITTASDWFGPGILSGCSIQSCIYWVCSYNLLTVAEGANVAFFD